MKKTMFVAIAILAIILGIVAYASAVTTSVAVTAAVNSVFDLSLDHAAVTFDSLTDPSVERAADLTSALTIKSNRNYSLTTKAADFSGVAGNTMAADLMSYKVSGDAVVAKTAFSNAEQTIIASGARGVQTYTNDFYLTPGWNTTPDSYSTSIVFTAIQLP